MKIIKTPQHSSAGQLQTSTVEDELTLIDDDLTTLSYIVMISAALLVVCTGISVISLAMHFIK
jgi:hypothetical protein